MALQLRISGLHHEVLKHHLLPQDGREAVAVALCGRYNGENDKILMVHDLTLIPHNECYTREWDLLCWPTERIIPYFDRIAKNDLAILKIHSHPGGYERFSDIDDRSDHEFFDSVFGWA
ncbi:MAG: Mov34/MPN/PAD-1 family protein, partial [Bacteroidetes bacterium]|nr:Mov34/MPN/PAD-1 family protein [Bacteroidota bacterium]